MSNARDLGNITTVGFTNDITISGGDLNFADNDKINIGTGNDLQLYHTGSASYIVDAGTGSLFVQGENLYLQNTSGNNYLQALSGGEVNLNYAGVKKIATTATGVTVTGDVAATTVTTTGNATIGGDLQIIGNLQVDGTTTTINSANLIVDDLNITVASGAVNAAAADGAGLTVDGANATLTYVATGDKWSLNKPLDITGNVIVSGTVDGRDVAADGTKLDGIESGATADQIITAGAGLTGGGTGDVTISHEDTSSQASVNNSGATVIQDVTLDTYGHVTAIGSTTLTAVTVGALPLSGGTLSGNLSINSANNSNGYNFHVDGGLLGSTTGDTVDLVNLRVQPDPNNGNSDFLTIQKRKHATGDSWLNASWRLQHTYSTANLAFIDFNPENGSRGIQIGTSNTRRILVNETGNVFINKATLSTFTQGFYVSASGQTIVAADDFEPLAANRNSDGNIIVFRRNSSIVGSISVTTSGTTYNTTSDYRLKDNVQPITDGAERIQKLKPVTHSWKADPDTTVDGFLAHEVQEAGYEYAVNGQKDGDDMQSMDYGRITPVIVAALQDALKEIEQLKARITELEAK